MRTLKISNTGSQVDFEIHKTTAQNDSSIHRFLTEDAAETLVTSYILSRLDYCNCLLVGTLNSVIKLLFAARLVLLAPRHHQTPLLEKLHWLPISERIKSLVCVSVL